MAFNITAQVILSGPKNLNQVTKNISSSLSKAGSFKLNIDPRAASALNTVNKSVIVLTNNFVKLNQQIQTTQASLNRIASASKGLSSGFRNIASQQSTLQSQTNKSNASLQTQSSLLTKLGGRFKSVALQAVAFGAISRPVFELQRAFTGAVKDAIAFQREIVRISQVTGKSVQQLSGLTDQINNLATSLGISANELAETSRIIAQAGIRGRDLEQVLAALARSTLAPTFGKITDTTEGLIAAMGQFRITGADAEAVLGALNRVSKEFAVEAEDLISVIRRTGGVFAQAAGQGKEPIQALEELISVFTAVRSTTRESADTIAAGLRTIFSRIQRRGTINFLKQFGVDLVDAQGNFIGIFPAFDQLSKRLDTLIKQGDALTLSAIAEELGGIRQIGKLLPAIANFDKARRALAEAQRGATEGLSGDVAKALDTIDNRLKRVRESFQQLIRNVFESSAFQNFAKNILQFTEGFLSTANRLVDALEPILPILSTIGAFKLGAGISNLLSGGGISLAVSGISGQATAQASAQTAAAVSNQTGLISTTNTILNKISAQVANLFSVITNDNNRSNTQMANLISINNAGFNSIARALASKPLTVPVAGFAGATGRKKSGGGKIYGFARGGMVPGTGNSDTVPAMLQPGEFVIKKSSVGSIGAGTLEAMNNNRYADGGTVVLRVKPDKFGGLFLSPSTASDSTVYSPGKSIKGPSQAALLKKLEVENKGLYQSQRFPAGQGQETRKASQARIDFGYNQGSLKSNKPTIALNSRSPLLAFLKSPAGTAFRGATQKGNPTLIRDQKDAAEKAFRETQKVQRQKFQQGKYNDIKIAADRGAMPALVANDGDVKTGLSEEFTNIARAGIQKMVSDIIKTDRFKQIGPSKLPKIKDNILKSVGALFQNDPKGKINSARASIEGYLFEGVIGGLTGSIPESSGAAFDFLNPGAGDIEGWTDLFGSAGASIISRLRAADAKRALTKGNKQSLLDKTGSYLAETSERLGKFVTVDPIKKTKAKRAASGGSISGSDTVPALLTPGEFVLNKESAKKVGYGTLNKMNKTGVAGFAKGGIVGVQRFAKGGALGEPAERRVDPLSILFALQAFTATTTDADSAMGQLLGTTLSLISVFTLLQGVMSILPSGGGGLVGSFTGLGEAIASTLATRLTSTIAPIAGVVGTLSSGVLFTAAGAILGKVIGDMVAPKIGDAIFGATQKIEGSDRRGSKDTQTAISRGRVEGGIKGGLIGAGTGAGIGATIGTLIAPGIGTAIGAAIGAVIGGIGGAITGVFVGALNAPLEQAAFESAKTLKENGDRLNKSLDDISQQFNVGNFAKFNRDFIAQGQQFSSTVEQLTYANNNAYTLSNGWASLIGDSAQKLRNADKAFLEAAKIIGPEQIDKIQNAIDQGLDKFLDDFTLEELKALDVDKFESSLSRAAASGDAFAIALQRSISELTSIKYQEVAASFTDTPESFGESLVAPRMEPVIGRTLREISLLRARKQPGEGEVDFVRRMSREGRFEQIARAESSKGLAESPEAYESRIKTVARAAEQEARAIAMQTEAMEKEALARVTSAKLLKQLNIEIQTVIKDLKQPFMNLEIGLNTLGSSLGTLSTNIDAVFAGTGQATFRKFDATSLQGTSDLAIKEQERFFNAFDSLAGPGASRGLRDVQRYATEGQEIIRKALQSSLDDVSAETDVTGAQIIDRLKQDFESAGFQLPSALEDFINTGTKREGESDISTRALKDLIQNERLLEQFGEVFDAANEQLTNGFDRINQALEIAQKRIALEADLLQKQRQFVQTIADLNIAAEQRRDEILAGGIRGQASRRDPIAQSIDRLNRRLTATAGSSNERELLNRRNTALRRQSEIQREVEAGKIPTAETERELVALQDEISSTSSALDMLSKDTEVFAAILERAGQIGQNIGALESGLEDIINKFVSGDVAGIQGAAIDQMSIDRVARGVATLPQALRALQALGQEQNQALVDAASGRIGAGADLRQLLLRQLGVSLAQGGGTAGAVTSNILRGILVSEQEKDKLAIIAEERAKSQEANLIEINLQNRLQTQLLKDILNVDISAEELFNTAVNNFNVAVDKFIKASPPAAIPGGMGAFPGAALGPHTGGLIGNGVLYRSTGGGVPSKGTDTVPAMLSTGEFVVRKSAVDKVGMGAMHALNEGRAMVASTGGVVYRAGGGPIYRRNGDEIFALPKFDDIITQNEKDQAVAQERRQKEEEKESRLGKYSQLLADQGRGPVGRSSSYFAYQMTRRSGPTSDDGLGMVASGGAALSDFIGFTTDVSDDTTITKARAKGKSSPLPAPFTALMGNWAESVLAGSNMMGRAVGAGRGVDESDDTVTFPFIGDMFRSPSSIDRPEGVVGQYEDANYARWKASGSELSYVEWNRQMRDNLTRSNLEMQRDNAVITDDQGLSFMDTRPVGFIKGTVFEREGRAITETRIPIGRSAAYHKYESPEEKWKATGSKLSYEDWMRIESTSPEAQLRDTLPSPGPGSTNGYFGARLATRRQEQEAQEAREAFSGAARYRSSVPTTTDTTAATTTTAADAGKPLSATAITEQRIADFDLRMRERDNIAARQGDPLAQARVAERKDSEDDEKAWEEYKEVYGPWNSLEVEGTARRMFLNRRFNERQKARAQADADKAAETQRERLRTRPHRVVESQAEKALAYYESLINERESIFGNTRQIAIDAHRDMLDNYFQYIDQYKKWSRDQKEDWRESEIWNTYQADNPYDSLLNTKANSLYTKTLLADQSRWEKRYQQFIREEIFQLTTQKERMAGLVGDDPRDPTRTETLMSDLLPVLTPEELAQAERKYKPKEDLGDSAYRITNSGGIIDPSNALRISEYLKSGPKFDYKIVGILPNILGSIGENNSLFFKDYWGDRPMEDMARTPAAGGGAGGGPGDGRGAADAAPADAAGPGGGGPGGGAPGGGAPGGGGPGGGAGLTIPSVSPGDSVEELDLAIRQLLGSASGKDLTPQYQALKNKFNQSIINGLQLREAGRDPTIAFDVARNDLITELPLLIDQIQAGNWGMNPVDPGNIGQIKVLQTWIMGAIKRQIELSKSRLNINYAFYNGGGSVTGAAGAASAASSLGSQIGVNFKPKGTDTVPAMLTPGEFVVKKSAVDKVGVGAMHALNEGRAMVASTGGVVYRASGGPIYMQEAGLVPLTEGHLAEDAVGEAWRESPVERGASSGMGSVSDSSQQYQQSDNQDQNQGSSVTFAGSPPTSYSILPKTGLDRFDKVNYTIDTLLNKLLYYSTNDKPDDAVRIGQILADSNWIKDQSNIADVIQEQVAGSGRYGTKAQRAIERRELSKGIAHATAEKAKFNNALLAAGKDQLRRGRIPNGVIPTATSLASETYSDTLRKDSFNLSDGQRREIQRFKLRYNRLILFGLQYRDMMPELADIDNKYFLEAAQVRNNYIPKLEKAGIPTKPILNEIIASAQNPEKALMDNGIGYRLSNNNPITTYHAGGMVQGFSRGGNVPIMAQDGEFVMRRDAVKKYGTGMLERMNRGGEVAYRQTGGMLANIGSGIASGIGRAMAPQTAMIINGADTAKELNNAIITGGKIVKDSWQMLFNDMVMKLNMALGKVSTIPEQINATIAPIQIEGVDSFATAIVAQLVPKIEEKLKTMMPTNNGGSTEQGSMGGS